MTLENDTLAALEAARMRVIEQTERARAAAREAAAMAEDVRLLTRTTHSPGRELAVTAQAGGAVDRIELTPRALEWDAATLSRVLTETVRQAQRSAADSAVQRMAASVGTDSPLLADVRAGVRAQYGTELH